LTKGALGSLDVLDVPHASDAAFLKFLLRTVTTMADPSSADPTVAGNRYFRVTDQDHRGVILVVSIICAAFIPMILALRGTFTSKTIPYDEGLAIAVSVCITSCAIWRA
jgi:hypothetical protein